MASTFTRYVFNRWLSPLLGSVLFFSGLALAYNLVRASREVFAQGAAARWILPLLSSTLPETLSMVLPMAAILGGMLGTQQLSESSEMVASRGLGIGLRVILKPWLLLSALLVTLASINAHLVIPPVSAMAARLQSKMFEETRTRFLRPGAPPFFPANDPTTGFWFSPDSEIHVFQVTETGARHLVAKNLEWQKDEQNPMKPFANLSLKDIQGSIYQKQDKSVGLLAQRVQNYRIKLPTSSSRMLTETPARYVSTVSLVDLGKTKGPNRRLYLVELARRITLPLSSMVFLLLGIAIGLHHPRFRQGWALLRSLSAIILYYLALKGVESGYLIHKQSFGVLLMPPLLFGGAAAWLLLWKIRPHRTYFFSPMNLRHRCHTLWVRWGFGRERAQASAPEKQPEKTHRRRFSVLPRWTRRSWWRSWGGVLGTLLTLNLMLEFAAMAGDLARSEAGFLTFLEYWVWNLPEFLSIAFPVSFLLGGVLVLSDATMNREWLAMRAGGASLVQWVKAGALAWGGVLAMTLLVQSVVAPMTAGRAYDLSRQIRNRAPRSFQTKPWMHLTSTGVVWFLDHQGRWGFPLQSQGKAPVFYWWKQGDLRVQALPWNALAFEKGPEAAEQFPIKALRESANAEETGTIDLFYWQKWAPDPERATLLWSRLFNWLAGPCLMFSMLAFAFPTPRGGRGRALGASLVAGLLFLGLQAIFGGAARAGEIPAYWGVVAPMLVLVGFGFFNLHRLRT